VLVLGDDLFRRLLLPWRVLILLDAMRHTSSRTTSVGVDQLIPLLEKCSKTMIRALDRVPASCRARGDAKVRIGIAGQVNLKG
jgi:hypothetical protein